jgi:hypothetical protein
MRKYIGGLLLLVGVLLILHSNWAYLPFFDVLPPGTIAFSIPADGSSYTEIDKIEIIIADPSFSDPSFLKTVMYNDTLGITMELIKDPVITTKWVGLLNSPIKTEGQFRFWFFFWSWEGLPYPYPGDWVWNETVGEYQAEGGKYSITTSSQDGDGTHGTTDWYRILETSSGVAFLISGISLIVRREKKWKNIRSF